MIIPELDKNSSTPLYVQLYNYLSNRMINGTLAAGTKLPSQREFAAQLGISVNTVVNAYNMLIQYNYIISKNKSGYYVNKSESPNIEMPERHWRSNTPSIYNFSRNGADLHMNSEFKKALRQTARDISDRDFKYPDYTGTYELRKSISSMLSHVCGISCDPAQIIIGSGIIYLLDALLKIIGHDKIYGLENPTYYKISNYMRLSNLKTKYINVTDSGIGSDIKGFTADVLFLMPYNHYPLGYVMDKTQKEAVLDWSSDNRYIIEYGYDIEHVYSGSHETLYSMSKNKNVIFVNDFTRTAAPELGLAYMVLPETLVRSWQQDYPNYHSYASVFDQNFLCEIIRNGSYYRNIKRLCKLYKHKCDILTAAIRSHPIGSMIKIKNKESGSFLIIEVMTDKCSAEELLDECHKQGVKISYIQNALEQPNPLIPPTTCILGFGELSDIQICEGIHLLLDTWQKMI